MDNSPHLKVAYELDEAILEFSVSLESEYGLSPIIGNEDDLRQVLAVFKHDHLPKYRLQVEARDYSKIEH